MFSASTPAEIETAFDGIVERRPDALLVGGDPFYIAQRAAIVARAGQLSLPTIYPFRQFVEVGGLMSYGTNIPNSIAKRASMLEKFSMVLTRRSFQSCNQQPLSW